MIFILFLALNHGLGLKIESADSLIKLEQTTTDDNNSYDYYNTVVDGFDVVLKIDNSINIDES